MQDKWNGEMEEQVGKAVLDYQFYPGEDQYTDGNIEEEMLALAKEYGDAPMDRVIAERKSWPILYHFSHIRENIIDWLPMTGRERVLEIGAGPGAVTGALLRKAAQVTCIDLSRRRSLINAYRHQNCENLRILVGNFQDIEEHLNEDFDLITLIGVFEYAQYSIQSERPFVEYLERIRRRLAPEGRVVIAIENRLGLKYWAGATEDHTGIYFEGLEGYPTTDYVRTFSKPELEAVIREAGFENLTFYYPYPDYKLPEKIYSDEYLPRRGELNRNTQNFDRERMRIFSEELVYDSLVECGQFPQFSNSFLVIAS
ncbi:MAG: methyltransferase [Lachnospiraceae bacterium]|nr:methyltransferase [Lachnospiraceae bacterium]